VVNKLVKTRAGRFGAGNSGGSRVPEIQNRDLKLTAFSQETSIYGSNLHVSSGLLVTQWLTLVGGLIQPQLLVQIGIFPKLGVNIKIFETTTQLISYNQNQLQASSDRKEKSI